MKHYDTLRKETKIVTIVFTVRRQSPKVFPIGRLFAAYMSHNVEVVLQNFVKVWERYKKSGPGSLCSFSFHT
jgi:hypothetical protein